MLAFHGPSAPIDGEMHANERSRLDRQLDALADVERRRVLFALLRERSGRDARRKRSESSAAVEVDELGDDAVTASQVEMYHTHLPKLADYGFVSWNSDSGVVIAGSRFEEIEPLLELIADSENELATVLV